MRALKSAHGTVHGKLIWKFLNVGCEVSWPKGQALGGWPARVHVKLFKICDDASEFPDVAALAQHVQLSMQRELDGVYQDVDRYRLKTA